jgi:phosphoglycolate phosphatase
MAYFKVVVFDFDYTLADSSRGVLECINYALRGLGLPQVDAEEAQRTIGLSLTDTLVTLRGREHAHREEEFASLFIKRADEVMADLTVVFDHTPIVIGYLKRRGLSLGIVSTKFRYRIEAILGRVGLLEPFDVIVGGEDVSRHKPDPEGLLRATRMLKGTKSDTLYVGDSVTDAETARRAGIPFIAVLSGVTPREAFKDYPALLILEDLKGLIASTRKG